MDRHVPSVEIDEEIREKAKACADFCWKESQKIGVTRPTRVPGMDTFYVGFLGELAVRKYFHLPLIVKRYLDYSYDLKLEDNRIDVKTSLLRKPLQQPVKEGFKAFVATEEKLLYVDTILFVKLEPDYSKAHLLGWIGRGDLERFAVTRIGDMWIPAYTIYFRYMSRVEDLGNPKLGPLSSKGLKY